ncbi:hypothetical protein [Paenibacillus tyrfis]|uniref:hypothetical protein n=1 Tax=Paenibacillus tyrfis TaxID=1501230 RepID=UPI000B58C566|nr:hypothetical protein [Paenibacillus tyrfis]
MYNGPAAIGEQQLKKLASELQVGETHPFYIPDENLFCVVAKVSDDQLKMVKGNKPLIVGPTYLEGVLSITVDDSPEKHGEIVVIIENAKKAKGYIQDSISKGIEFYFVNEHVTSYSIKRLFIEELSKFALSCELEKI